MNRCRTCRGVSHLIVGDGPTIVCWPCVQMLGGIVRKPETADDRILGLLDELHADVVTLAREKDRLTWKWIGDQASTERPPWHGAGAS